MHTPFRYKNSKELAKIYALPLEAYKWIMTNRMKPDRAKASVKRYVKNAIQNPNCEYEKSILQKCEMEQVKMQKNDV